MKWLAFIVCKIGEPSDQNSRLGRQRAFYFCRSDRILTNTLGGRLVTAAFCICVITGMKSQ